MTWDDAEAAIRAHIEAAWAAGPYAAIPLQWENERDPVAYAGAPETDRFIALTIDGVYADKWGYGGTGKKGSVEGGIVFFHCFAPQGAGKAAASKPVRALTEMLELLTLSSVIDLEGGNPPSPADLADPLTPIASPGGNYFRCSGSVPFIIRGTR